MRKKKLNINIGTKFGKWRVISTDTIRRNNLTHWECECECGSVDFVALNNLMNGKSTQCRHCGAKEVAEKRKKGYGDITGTMWVLIKQKAKNKNIPFNITKIEAWNLFLKQNKKCPLSGEELVFSPNPYNKENETAVLDLINPNSESGYYVENCQWVHKDISNMKRNLSNETFISLCVKVFNTNKDIQNEEG